MDLRHTRIDAVMTRAPRTINADALAAEAAQLMETYKINALLVTNGQGQVVGALNIHAVSYTHLDVYKRQGYTASALKLMVERVGISKQNSLLDISILEGALRDDLDAHAPRRMAVIDPLKVCLLYTSRCV